MQSAVRGRSARRLSARMVRDERAEVAVEVLVWHVRGWLPRRRFNALRRAARVLQPAWRAMVLRWEVLGVRELRRSFHRRFVAHRQLTLTRTRTRTRTQTQTRTLTLLGSGWVCSRRSWRSRSCPPSSSTASRSW